MDIKKLVTIGLALMALGFFSVSVWSIDTEMTTVVKVKDIFGYNGLTGNDLSSLNPAAAAMLDMTKVKGFGGVSYGSANFQSGPAFNLISALAWVKIGQNQALRVGQYTAVSNTGPIKTFGQNVEAKFTSHTTEISYGWKMAPDLYAGISVSPETINGTFSSGDVSSWAKVTPSWNYRIGVCKMLYGFFPLHLIYASDEFKAEQTIAGLHSSGHYRQQSLTAGVSFFGYLTLAHQFESLKGPGIDEGRSLRSIDITLPFGKTYLEWAYADHGSSYSLKYNDPVWYMGAAVSNNGYRRDRAAFGTANTFSCWAGRWL